MKRNLLIPFILLIGLILALGSGCNTSKAAKGGVIGGAAGGVIGGAIGKKSGDGTKGAVIGAVIGGTAGAIIGDYMDKQAEEIEEEIPGARVEKVQTVGADGEPVTESVTVTFDSGVLFGFDSDKLTNASKDELDRMANVFAKYPDTDITVDGHTDSKGTEAYNQTLSEKRAAAVSDYLASRGIARSRMITRGYGESRPVTTNDTEAGRAQNRRVEVGIKANENLQRRAEEQAGGQ